MNSLITNVCTRISIAVHFTCVGPVPTRSSSNYIQPRPLQIEAGTGKPESFGSRNYDRP